MTPHASPRPRCPAPTPQRRHADARRTPLRLGLLWLVSAIALPGFSESSEVLRIGVSQMSFGPVNRNDATAALKAWTTAVTRDLHMNARIQVEVFESESTLGASIRSNGVEAATMTTSGLFKCGVHPPEVFVSAGDGGYERNYIVLTQNRSAFHDLASLKSRELAVHVASSTSPALPWLDTVVHGPGTHDVTAHFGRVQHIDSASKCVLRVFFGQSDACLVAAQSFEVACELNPQLRSRLGVVATSPPLVSSIFFFRPNYASPLRSRVEDALSQLHSSVAGKQLLTVYMATHMERRPIECLDVTRDLMENHRRLPSHPSSAGDSARGESPAEPSPGTRPSP